VQRAYYGAASQWNGDAEGHVMFNSIIDWAMQQMAGEPKRVGRFAGDFKQPDLVPLPQLWGKAYVYDQNNQMQPRTDTTIIYPEGGLVIKFIEAEYGAEAMPKLLAALATARSFENLIEKSLGVPFAEFDQKWQAWAEQNITRQ
ncbi:MAG: hypothetical protein HGB05_11835, partial [Chloroflexi bacterium]|nr:hypothetical protein [Chloroflexota bacterium]